LKLNNQNNSDVEAVEKLQNKITAVKKEIAKIIIGQEETINLLLTSLFARGHCLLVGVPGLAKTLLIKTLAEVLDLEFNRIQFTPDLMPGDITGTEIIEEDRASKQRRFRFIKGPIFANIVLADEINRTPPKTQSALLEAMQENKVTAAGKVYLLSQPFFVLATQNPIEQEGTYPLPEAQLDRFMFELWVDYPGYNEEIEIIKTTTTESNIKLNKVLNAGEIIAFQELVRRVPVANNVIEYAVSLTSNTRPQTTRFEFIKQWVNWGAGPRASQYLILAAKTKAIMEGRFSPSIEDVKSNLAPVLRHRIIPNFSAEAEGITSMDIITKLIEQ